MFARTIDRTDSTLMAMLVVALIAALAPLAAHAAPFIRIVAYVDGRDQLIIQGNTLQWHHFDYAAVGRVDGRNFPTFIERPEGAGPVWYPQWPYPPPDEIRFEAYSSVSRDLTPPLPAEDRQWHVTKRLGRGPVRIVQQPSATNSYELIVEFADNEPLGGTLYLIDLSPAQPVVIDIRPLSRRNAVGLGPNAVISVAVLSNLLPAGFDATQLVPSSVNFGQIPAPLMTTASPVSHTLTDVNHDGHLDAVFVFNVSETQIHCGDAEAVLTGMTTSGELIEGRDVVRTRNCQ